MSLADASSVTRVGDGEYTATIQPGWDIAGKANGGYLLAIAARAASDAADGRVPLTVTGHFVAPGERGPASVRAEVVKAGRRFTTVRATLSDPRHALLTILGTFADESAFRPDAPERVEGAPPDLPPPDESERTIATSSFPPPIVGQVDLRLHPADADFDAGEPRMRGWLRLLDDEPIDAFGLILAVDVFAPTIFNAGIPVDWTPTVELTAHVRAVPTPGWLACAFRSRFISGGFLETDGEVWDESGRLVAQSRQLALIPQGAA